MKAKDYGFGMVVDLKEKGYSYDSIRVKLSKPQYGHVFCETADPKESGTFMMVPESKIVPCI